MTYPTQCRPMNGAPAKSQSVAISRELAREFLIDTISELCELAWSASWMDGVEFALLRAMTNGNQGGFFDPELLRRARSLAESLNEWPLLGDGSLGMGFYPFDSTLEEYGNDYRCWPKLDAALREARSELEPRA